MSCSHSESTGKGECAGDGKHAAGADPSALALAMEVVSATLSPRTLHETRGEKEEGEKRMKALGLGIRKIPRVV
jgi:hypothetical protein